MGQRQSFAGAAASTTLTSAVGSTDTTISVSSTTNWPDTANGSFVITLDRGTNTEEKVMVSSYTSSLLTCDASQPNGGRGYDGTTAQTHAAGSGTAVPTIDAAWHQDVSDQLYLTDAGDIWYSSADATPGKLAVGADGDFLTVTDGLPAWTSNVLEAVYPVGSIYLSTVSTNAATLLGFGTWTAFAAGSVIIGVGTSDETFEAGATGGASNVTLTAAQSGLPAHTHTDSGHTHPYIGSGTSGSGTDSGGEQSNAVVGSGQTTSSGTANLEENAAADASSSHNNLPPYIVAYIWQRTA